MVSSKGIAEFFLQEVVLRGSLQEGISWGVQKGFSSQEIEVFSFKVHSATLIAIVATSILFGSARIISGAYVPFIMVTTLGSIMYGVLASHYGLSSLAIARMIQRAVYEESSSALKTSMKAD